MRNVIMNVMINGLEMRNSVGHGCAVPNPSAFNSGVRHDAVVPYTAGASAR